MMSRLLHLSGKDSLCKCGIPIEDTSEQETVVYTESQLKREILLYDNTELCHLCSTEFVREFIDSN